MCVYYIYICVYVCAFNNFQQIYFYAEGDLWGVNYTFAII